jgi:cell division septation protein DedD
MLIRTANIDKEELGSDLCWRPEGRCNSFTRASILASAPPSSGVYGLINFSRHIFIGESDNIREALLRHESEAEFESQSLRPTGFTFELCGADLRKLWAAELVARFHPVLQEQNVLTEPWSLDGLLNETYERDWKFGPDNQEFRANDHEEHPKSRWGFRIQRTQALLLGCVLVASAAVISYLNLPIDYSVQTHAIGASPTSGETTSLAHHSGSPLQNGSTTKLADTPAAETAEARSPELNRHGSPSGTTRESIQTNAVSSKVAESAEPAQNVGVSKTWSVQISAAPTKNVADNMAQQLKAQGYDGYVIEANVKGQTYHRVRVGRFPKREEAESTRQSLAVHESYKQAFIASN